MRIDVQSTRTLSKLNSGRVHASAAPCRAAIKLCSSREKLRRRIASCFAHYPAQAEEPQRGD